MRFQVYSPAKKRLRMKRHRLRGLHVLPTALLLPVLVLGAMALVQNRSVPSSRAQAVQSEQDAAPQPEAKGRARPRPEAAAGETADPAAEQGGEATADRQERPELKMVSGRIERGQTVSGVLGDYMDRSAIYAMSRSCCDVYSLRRIKAGHVYRLYLDGTGLRRFEYDIDAEKKLCVRFESGSIKASTEPIEYRVEREVVTATIDSSLFKAVSDQGETSELAIDLAGIFAWDVDFIRDVRSGDAFRLLVEKRYRFGEFAGYGDILAARFTSQGETYQAFLFDDGQGRAEYYNAEGKAVRKTFLKAPLNFTRISSGYSWNRKHPILDVVRPHLGIDYAAPRGTPIKSVADGEVVARARDRQAGNYVKIRHPNGYVSVYNHMSRFARGLRHGQEVAQGDVIGYVGTTGLSTGPHLDYRVKRYGKYVNPLNVKSEPVKPVPASKRDAFRRHMRSLVAALEGQTPLYAYAGQQDEAPAVP